jgi:RNA polymerase sigma-70 factor, ECF subfamily
MNRIREKILLYRIRTSQDAEAYAELYDHYVEKIYRFIYLKVSHQGDAEDLTSDVFLKVWKYLTRSEGVQARHFSGLLYKIARNSVVDHYRNRAKTQEKGLEEIEMIASQQSVEKDTWNKIDAEYLINQLASLKQEYQEIVLLRYTEGLSISEIAEIVGKKQTNVRVTLHRAMKLLKQRVHDEK